MTAPVWIATPGGAAYCVTPAKPAPINCTVCAYVDQPKGKPCKLCGRTEAPERRE
jgi:hypothetical protein